MEEFDPAQRITRIEQRFRQRSNYAVHAVFFVCSAILFLLFLRDPASARQWLTLPNTGDLFLLLTIWLVIFAAHSVRFYFQEQLARAVRREMTDFEAKPKRHMRLEDDGEMVDIADESPRQEDLHAQAD
ncbi:MAG: hypothetical protein K8J31_12790 [Anaerolineae bacterium]|nr:hypothetical protein [Anaerolineae bacterium]